jgi:proteic killer suppression protein
MVVEYRTKKLKKQCENPDIAQKDLGTGIGRRLTQRVSEFLAASTLADIKDIPAARLYKLEGDRKNQYAVDLVHPHRLLFRPVMDDENTIKKLELITVIQIEEVIDYHGKNNRS